MSASRPRLMQIYRSHDPLLDLEPPLELEAEASIRALVVGDDPLVRSSFVQRLAGAAAGDARTDDDLGEAVAAAGANLVLWDLGPVSDDAQATSLEAVSVPVVALCPEGTNVRRLLSRGAAAVLLREVSSRSVLRNALRSVLSGLTVIDPRLGEATPDDEASIANDTRAPIQPLTGREQEVLELMAMGLSNKQIGDRLGISANTAKFHIGAILAKLDAQSRTEAVVRAVQRGLVMV